MLYCNPCGKKRGWPIDTQVQSHGFCDVCHTAGSLNHVNTAPVPEEVFRLRQALIDERAKHLKAMDDAYPDVGWGLTAAMARDDAIKQLKNEGLIPADYEEA